MTIEEAIEATANATSWDARVAAIRLIPEEFGFAVLGGLGWTRTSDALGPVVRDTDGRVFTIPTLREIVTVQPLSSIAGTQF